MTSSWVGYQTQIKPQNVKLILYQLQVEEGITHGRKPELIAYRGLKKLQVTTSNNK